jgi:hypothetical protein
MQRTPRAKAGNARDFLGFLEQIRPGTGEQLRRALPAEVWSAVTESARSDWTPIELDGVFVSEIVKQLGAAPARDAWRRFTHERFIRTPAIRAIAEGAVAIFGRSLGSFVNVIPLAFRQGFRDFAEVRVEGDRTQATATLENLAAGTHFDAYAVLFEGVFTGVFDITGSEVRLDYRPSREARRIVAVFRWGA